MIDAGMNVACIDFNSKNIEDHERAIENLRVAIGQKQGRKCSVHLNFKDHNLELVKPIAFDRIDLKAG